MEFKVIGMSEEPKKTNKYLTRYEQIYQKLAKVTNFYLKSKKPEHFELFITSERGINNTGLNNLLIELPEGNVIDILKEQYMQKPNNEGEIGTIEPENQAYEVRNIALLMLMSNRLSKEYKNRIEKNRNIDEKTKAMYAKNEKDLLVWKNNAQSDLLASLYILKKTGGKEYTDYFSYGDWQDKDNKTTAFVIDLPYIGQISVHFGPEKRNNVEEAKRKVIAILERKRALGQIEKSEFKRLKEEVSINEILPNYKGKLYEYSSTLPIEYIGPTAKDKIEEIGVDSKLPEEIGKQDIQKMIENGLNEREAYYLAIKLGCSKMQLKQVIKEYNNIKVLSNSKNSNEEKITTETKIGRKAVRMTTTQERAMVLRYEQINLQSYREERNDKAVGGE